MNDAASQRGPDRLTTGVPGLDDILLGGLLRRGVYIVQGKPGGGKTIMANQIAFHQARLGACVLYITLLAETHERLLQYVEQLDFFDSQLVTDRIHYFSGFTALQDSGLKGFTEMLRREARARRSTLLVIDGLVAAEERAETDSAFKKFIQELQIHANLLGHTVLLLTSAKSQSVRAEHTMVDGVIEVSDNRVGRRSERELEVKKFRGSDYLRGGHSFQITRLGIAVYPRLEALLQDPSREDSCQTERTSTGIADLDLMLHGGLRRASSTVLFGPTGAGKTSLGLHFLSRSSPADPGLLFGFYETPERILEKARQLGLPLDELVRDGSLQILWFPATERLLDALGHRLLATVAERKVRRVFVDGIEGFLKAAAHPERISHFLSALTNELRTRGVTTLFSSELRHIFSSEVRLPLEGVSSLVENILLIRMIEQQGGLSRVCSVIKTRDSAYDQGLRELVISSRGIHLGEIITASFGVQHNMAPAPPFAWLSRRVLRQLLRKRG